MEIRELVTTDFERVDGETRASKLEGIFEDPEIRAVVVERDGEYAGVVSRRQLATGHIDPNARVKTLVWHVARAAPDDNVRDVARRLVGSTAEMLPVFEDDELVGVVTVDGIVEAVQPYLLVLAVSDVYSAELVSIGPKTTLGEALHTFRENNVTHLPVVEDDTPVGIVSLFDVVGFTVRDTERSTGGSPPGFDAHGGEASGSGYRTHGGFGAREGDIDRLLDVPVATVMVEPVETVASDERLDRAAARMLDAGISSLVVTVGDDPVGIVTKTDVLTALTWTDEPRFPVQIVGIDYLDDITRDEVGEMIEGIASKYGRMTVQEANVYLHQHDETYRGLPLLLARIRLFTDKGHFVGTGEGYGATHALHVARNTLERQLLEGKEYGRTKKHPTSDQLEKMLGWWLTGTSRQR